VSNGYPWEVVEKTTNEAKTGKIQRSMNEVAEKKEECEFFDVIHAPYVGGFSEKVQRKLREFNVGFVMKKGKSFGNMLCNGKWKEPFEKNKDIVYAIGCKTCKMHYIGETSQRLEERRKQHQSDVRRMETKNGISHHRICNPDHEIEWDKVRILESERNWTSRKIKESLFIRSMNPAKEMNNLMNLDKGRDIHQGWDRFLPKIKTMVQKMLSESSRNRRRLENAEEEF
jgi:hypothetical protein